MKHSYQIVSLFILLILSACKETTSTKVIDTNGYWTSEGYGRVLKVQDDAYNLYDITSISCVDIQEGHLSDYGTDLTIAQDTLTLKDGINFYYFTRLNNAPTICSEVITDTQRNDPEYNFEVLAETFKNEYAYFELRQVNWKAMYKRYRAKVTPETTSAELYRIMEDMLDEFNDGHIGLEAPEAIEEAAELLRVTNNTNEIVETAIAKKRYGNHQVSNLIAQSYVKKLKSRANKMLQWGHINDTLGYLQINQMFGFADYQLADSLSGREFWMAYFDKVEASKNHTADEVKGVTQLMPEVLKDLKTTRALILDVRFNGGGKDEAALEFMKYFNPKERVVFSKKARKGNDYTQPNYVTLESLDKAYTKPVYLLTSHESASATEIMILSSLLLEHVTKVGSKTEGVFSDVLDKLLPNGWEVDLSNEVYLDTKGNNYESIGIPANINLKYSKNKQAFLSRIVESLETTGDEAIEQVLNLK